MPTAVMDHQQTRQPAAAVNTFYHGASVFCLEAATNDNLQGGGAKWEGTESMFTITRTESHIINTDTVPLCTSKIVNS